MRQLRNIVYMWASQWIYSHLGTSDISENILVPDDGSVSWLLGLTQCNLNIYISFYSNEWTRCLLLSWNWKTSPSCNGTVKLLLQVLFFLLHLCGLIDGILKLEVICKIVSGNSVSVYHNLELAIYWVKMWYISRTEFLHVKSYV